MFRSHPIAKKGFTLIELLVVISIIGVLASTVLASLNDARDKAFDAKRKQDLRSMQTAFEAYYNDNGVYPPEQWCDSSVGSTGTSNCHDMIAAHGLLPGWDPSSSFYQAVMNSGVISELPVDPINDETHHYLYEPSNLDDPNPGDQDQQGHYVRVRLSDGSWWGVCSGVYEGRWSWCH